MQPQKRKIYKQKGKSSLESDVGNLSQNRLLFTNIGHMVLLVLAFILSPWLGGLYLIYWLFITPYLELKRLRERKKRGPQ